MNDAYDEFYRMSPYPMEITVRQAFEAGYKAALEDQKDAWDDGYAHGYDEGRYKSIEEGF